MKHCKKCNIDVNTEGHVCPICNDVLVEKKEDNVNNPNGYPQLINKHRFPFVVKLFAFLSMKDNISFSSLCNSIILGIQKLNMNCISNVF